MNNFSDTLVYLRKRDGLSQQELANKMNVSRSLIGMFESGQRMPSVEVLEAIADTFNVGADFLIGRVDSGEYSTIFRQNLAHIMEQNGKNDIAAAGIDEYEAALIIEGTISLSLDCACRISDQLGESIDTMIGAKKPTLVSEDGLNDIERLLMEYVKSLTPDQQKMLLAQMQVMKESQKERSASAAQD